MVVSTVSIHEYNPETLDLSQMHQIIQAQHENIDKLHFNICHNILYHQFGPSVYIIYITLCTFILAFLELPVISMLKIFDIPYSWNIIIMLTIFVVLISLIFLYIIIIPFTVKQILKKKLNSDEKELDICLVNHKRHIFFVKTQDEKKGKNKVIGFLILERQDNSSNPEERLAYIKSILIEDESRKIGAGTKLINHIINYCNQRHIPKVIMSISHNDDILSFFQKFGYKINLEKVGNNINRYQITLDLNTKIVDKDSEL